MVGNIRPILSRRYFMPQVQLGTVHLPDFGLPAAQPEIPAATYEARIQTALQRAQEAGFEVLVVYADREHFANLTYLTGYDPRFEEALLIVKAGQTPTLLAGNEGLGYSEISPVKLNRVLYQSFSLLGQPRESSLPLAEIFRQAGIGAGIKVGTAGWKHFDGRESATPDMWLELPSYIVDVLRELTGDKGLVRNANAIFMDAQNGLRAISDVDQLAAFEFGAAHASQCIRRVMFGVQPGMTEYEAAALMELNGIPISCYPLVGAHGNTSLLLSSPTGRVIQDGSPLFYAHGYWGGLSARAGFLVRGPGELPSNIRDYVDKLIVPFFEAIVAWYEHIGIGVIGGELYEIILKRLDDQFFGVGLNPGHLTHLDEWVNSPMTKDSEVTLQSGMAFQVDVIPATHTPYFTTNIEDTIALADEALRGEFQSKYPGAWARIQARRQFMETQLGIRLKPEVLPFSNIPAYLPPYLLSPQMAMKVVHA
jgi:peptidase M24-like protein